MATCGAQRRQGDHQLSRRHAVHGDRAVDVPGQDSLADLAELDLVVVTQPNFVAERGDQYLLDVAGEDLRSVAACLAQAGRVRVGVWA